MPTEPYVYAEWKKTRVHINYHVAIDGHYFSVPDSLIKKEVEAPITQTTTESFYQGNRIASHRSSDQKGHLPVMWTPDRNVLSLAR